MRNTQSEHKDPFLSTAAVARWLGISTRTVCFWAECGEIPALKVGRQWRFREEELRRWLDSSQEKLLAGRAIANNPSTAA
jgi:excisionase family DNA binding protein